MLRNAQLQDWFIIFIILFRLEVVIIHIGANSLKDAQELVSSFKIYSKDNHISKRIFFKKMEDLYKIRSTDTIWYSIEIQFHKIVCQFSTFQTFAYCASAIFQLLSLWYYNI